MFIIFILTFNLLELIMAYQSSVKLRGLSLNCDIGSYGINEVVPNKHRLDMELLVEKNLILVEEDKMDNVFDYDPLVEKLLKSR